MADTPPPLPIEAPLVTPQAVEEGKVAPPHAPLFWRTLAFLVDAILLALAGYLITTRLLMPWLHPGETAALNDWTESLSKYAEAQSRGILEGRTTVMHFYGDLFRKSKEIPDAALEAMSFQATCMMFFYWIGFAGMELATKGASLGKKMCRLRVARFPHGETPTVFDTLVRSCWKALAVAAFSPLSLLFAIVDAHWPLFNPLRRSLHDLFSRTVVLDARFDEPDRKSAATRADD